ncbi:MAG: XdhC family protein [Acetobacter fabarum]|uniref:XdhC family protein n=1 Tax=Acetobacter fabarum TaxID=483199 RepID=UPI0024311DA6|nr:XdhC family protein [Acetobacter fabarum]MCH4024974.1 XdhC family protein [Acetobacter fabarum]MCH4128554.1 XdhC family protein [Acetobacter fabarum]MCH4141765.1 XdhC family protein [Acetobacter fabarum]MCI1297672.1 XdhC family protein [Acetobacter fabarum]MCI1393464.1 XdhC family protein [Acetobacter fabarum]
MTVPAPPPQLLTPLDHALAWARAGEPVALATVTGTWGSSPRPAGSCMAISARGAVEGSVSGGCVETDVMTHAQDIMAGSPAQTLEYGVSSARAWEVGLACGGRLDVQVEAINSPACPTGTFPLALLEQVCACMANRQAAALVRLHNGTQHALVVQTEQGSTVQFGTCPPEICNAAHARLQHGRSGAEADATGQEWFVQPLVPAPRLLIVGAVHIAQSLARMASMVGLAPIVIDPRSALATVQRFPGLVPGQTLLTEWPDEAMQALGIDPMTAIATLTHDAKLDDPTLEEALRSPAFYIGALGSRKTQASRMERLRTLGFAEAELARIRGPIGLAIGAVGAEEIALSILADIVAVRRQAPLAQARGWQYP